jgi:hypothetical protein
MTLELWDYLTIAIVIVEMCLASILVGLSTVRGRSSLAKPFSFSKDEKGFSIGTNGWVLVLLGGCALFAAPLYHLKERQTEKTEQLRKKVDELQRSYLSKAENLAQAVSSINQFSLGLRPVLNSDDGSPPPPCDELEYSVVIKRHGQFASPTTGNKCDLENRGGQTWITLDHVTTADQVRIVGVNPRTGEVWGSSFDAAGFYPVELHHETGNKQIKIKSLKTPRTAH